MDSVTSAVTEIVAILTSSPMLLFIVLLLVPGFFFWHRKRLPYDPISDENEGIQAIAAGVHHRAMSVPSAALVEGQLPYPIPGLCIQAVMWFAKDVPAREEVITALTPITEKHYRYRAIAVRETSSGNVVWAETKVNLERHVVETTVTGEDEVQQYINDHISTKLSRDKPLWEVHIVHNRNGGKSVVVWYVDHAIGDGVSLMIVAHEAFRDANGADVPFVIPPKRPFFPTDMSFWQKLKYGATAFWSSLKIVYITQVLKDSSTVLHSGTFPNYVHHFPRVFILAPAISMEYLQKIRTAFLESKGYKVTLNDVLFSIFTSTIRRYLLYRKDPRYLDETSRKKLLLRIFMPLMFPRDPELLSDDMLHNYWSMISGKMAIGIDDAIERLVESKKVMDKIKSENQAWHMRQIQLRCIDLLGYDAMRYISIRATTAHTLAWSNVPGFEHKVSFAGRVVDDMNFILAVPISYITVFSYSGHVNATWTVDPELVTDREKLGFFQNLSVKELGDALGVVGDPVWKEGEMTTVN
ncbi:hypothetical protein M427DRAFT_67063 [Gonapodya prolifera JEL478]|uniref:Uncharacterized protein n=1 Tax=Gonapodya prolifera (strain JEL478) TaxID=1344416 RepID=A0A139ARP0_GONPJ|nr:hypothetical protein M427DRAFT_67063 [Gonapodya prolifera JEL478]|eukprot:KXS19401.1 hypothetical protein M427DRAFT_67063 [Gonapodya prolifera JEL478]